MGAKQPFAIAYVSHMPHSQLHLGVGMHPWHPEEQSCSAELRRTTCGATHIGGNPTILKLEGGTHLLPPCKITPWWNFITQAGLLLKRPRVFCPPGPGRVESWERRTETGAAAEELTAPC